MTSPPGAARRDSVEHALVLGLSLVVFAYVAHLRVVDDDEGYYALAGRAMVAEGLWPYRDFFLPQLPLAPLLFGVAEKLTGPGLGPLRLVAAVGASLSLWATFGAARRFGRLAGLCAAVLYGAHVLTWEWAVTIKAFPVVLPLLAGAVWAAMAARRPGHLAVAGLLAGLAASTRVLAAPVALAVLAAAWWAPERSDRRRRAAASGLGLSLGLLPVVLTAAAAADPFLFDNLGWHSIRAPGEGLVKDLPQKLETLGALLVPSLGGARPDATGLQTLAVTVLAIVGVRGAGGAGRIVAGLAALLALAALLPSPVWTQYFTLVLVPLCILGGRGLQQVASVRAGLGVLVVYTLSGAATFQDRIIDQPAHARPDAFDRVGAALDAVTQPGDRVAAHWPAYLVAAHRAPIPEARNQFARLYSDRVPQERRQRYHLFTEADLRDALIQRRAQAFVLGTFVEPETAIAVRDAGWVRARDLPGASVWVVPERAR